MTKQEIQALVAYNLADNNDRLITPEKLREVLTAIVDKFPTITAGTTPPTDGNEGDIFILLPTGD
jgi:hypothetical protein